VAGLLASKANPHWLSPLGGGARYFFIPYLLIFFASGLAVLKLPKLKYLVYGALTVLSVTSFSVFQRSDLQFKAYVEFARIKSDIFIPIQPKREAFPSWSIHLSNRSESLNKKSADQISLGLEDANMLNIINSKDGFSSLNKDPQLTFGIGERCSHTRYLGVEIHITRPEGGWVQLFWSERGNFSEPDSLRRYYPAGDAVVQFALPRKNIKYLRFDPLEKRSQFYINAVNLYCLGD